MSLSRIIRFTDEEDPGPHQRGNLFCPACSERSEDRYCDFCDGYVHIEQLETSDIDVLRCDCCDWSCNNDGKYY